MADISTALSVIAAITEAAMRLLDVIIEEHGRLDPSDAAEARQRLQADIASRVAKITADEAGDLSAIPGV